MLQCRILGKDVQSYHRVEPSFFYRHNVVFLMILQLLRQVCLYHDEHGLLMLDLSPLQFLSILLFLRMEYQNLLH